MYGTPQLRVPWDRLERRVRLGGVACAVAMVLLVGWGWFGGGGADVWACTGKHASWYTADRLTQCLHRTGDTFDWSLKVPDQTQRDRLHRDVLPTLWHLLRLRPDWCGAAALHVGVPYRYVALRSGHVLVNPQVLPAPVNVRRTSQPVQEKDGLCPDVTVPRQRLPHVSVAYTHVLGHRTRQYFAGADAWCLQHLTDLFAGHWPCTATTASPAS